MIRADAAQVLNMTDCISINHNWANCTNLPQMYAGLCDAMADTEAAVCDVRESLEAAGGDWRREWSATVQRILKLDSGWDCATFFAMIAQALSTLERPADAVDASPTSAGNYPALRPSTAAILDRVEPCVDDFVARFEALDEDARREALVVQETCHRLRLHDT